MTAQFVTGWTVAVSAVFALYLAVTAWASAGRGHAGWIEWATFPLAVGVAALATSLGFGGFAIPDGASAGASTAPDVVLAALAALAAAWDMRVILGGTIAARARAGRRRWRTWLAASVFAGAVLLAPGGGLSSALRVSPWALAPAVAALLGFIFWKGRPSPPSGRSAARLGDLVRGAG